VLLAALLWSSSGFFAKAPGFDGWPAVTLAFWRAAFACVILLPMVRQPRWSWKLIPTVLTFVIMNYTYITALVEGSPANAIWMQATSPIWVLLVGVFCLGEKADGRDWLLLACCVVGIGLILVCEWRAEQQQAEQQQAEHQQAGHQQAEQALTEQQQAEQRRVVDVSTGGQSLAGMGSEDRKQSANAQGRKATAQAGIRPVLYGIASGVFYAGVVLSLRQLRDFDSAWLVGLNHLGTAVILGPLVLRSGPWPTDPFQWTVVAAFGMFQMGLPYVLFARGLREIPGHEASGIGLLEPLLMPLWVLVAWGIRPAWWTIAGGGLILCGLLFKYAGTLRKSSSRINRPLD
jgi:drug/metabolite transporter (DMT)-like permease